MFSYVRRENGTNDQILLHFGTMWHKLIQAYVLYNRQAESIIWQVI